MAEAGKINTLMVTKIVDIGAYLDGENLGRILLPHRGMPHDCLVGSMLDVFIHYDQESRLIASTKRPVAMPGRFAHLKATKLTSLGAWLDWGLPNLLLAPTKEQKQLMEEGKSYLVRIVHDDKWPRIIATSKVDDFLGQSPADYKLNQEVDLLICTHTDLGYKAIVNDSHWGVIYENEIFRPLKKGDRLQGFIKKVRDDGKIDLCLQKPGYEKVDDVAAEVLGQLRRHGGFMAVSDKTAPELIYQLFGVSKKNFKKAVGALYKKKLVSLDEKGIRLNQ